MPPTCPRAIQLSTCYPPVHVPSTCPCRIYQSTSHPPVHIPSICPRPIHLSTSNPPVHVPSTCPRPIHLSTSNPPAHVPSTVHVPSICSCSIHLSTSHPPVHIPRSCVCQPNQRFALDSVMIACVLPHLCPSALNMMPRVSTTLVTIFCRPGPRSCVRYLSKVIVQTPASHDVNSRESATVATAWPGSRTDVAAATRPDRQASRAVFVVTAPRSPCLTLPSPHATLPALPSP